MELKMANQAFWEGVVVYSLVACRNFENEMQKIRKRLHC